MLVDPHGTLLAAVRSGCSTCSGCDGMMLEVALNILAQMQSLTSAGAYPVPGAANTYEMTINGSAKLRFYWNAPYAESLEFIC